MPFATNRRDGDRVYFEDDGGQGSPVVVLGGFLDPVELDGPPRSPGPSKRSLTSSGSSSSNTEVTVGATSPTRPRPTRWLSASRTSWRSSTSSTSNERISSGSPGGGRLCFGLGEHTPDRVRSLVIIDQQPYAIDPDGPLAHVVGKALAASKQQGIEALILAFEAIAGRYPDTVRAAYLACDAAAMRAAWDAAVAEGAVSEDLGSWRTRCLICVAADDVDFFDQAQSAADE